MIINQRCRHETMGAQGVYSFIKYTCNNGGGHLPSHDILLLAAWRLTQSRLTIATGIFIARAKDKYILCWYGVVINLARARRPLSDGHLMRCAAPLFAHHTMLVACTHTHDTADKMREILRRRQTNMLYGHKHYPTMHHHHHHHRRVYIMD